MFAGERGGEIGWGTIKTWRDSIPIKTLLQFHTGPYNTRQEVTVECLIIPAPFGVTFSTRPLRSDKTLLLYCL